MRPKSNSRKRTITQASSWAIKPLSDHSSYTCNLGHRYSPSTGRVSHSGHSPCRPWAIRSGMGLVQAYTHYVWADCHSHSHSPITLFGFGPGGLYGLQWIIFNEQLIHARCPSKHRCCWVRAKLPFSFPSMAILWVGGCFQTLNSFLTNKTREYSVLQVRVTYSG